MELQEAVLIISIITFVFGIVSYLFKKIVIEPLQLAIETLSDTVAKFEKNTNGQFDLTKKEFSLVNKEIDLLKSSTIRHEEQLKTLFNGRE